jgi:hypothetical protein
MNKPLIRAVQPVKGQQVGTEVTMYLYITSEANGCVHRYIRLDVPHFSGFAYCDFDLNNKDVINPGDTRGVLSLL